MSVTINASESGGSGQLVTVDSPDVNFNTMTSAINETIEYTRAFANEMKGTLSTAIETLQDVVGSYNPDDITVDSSLPPLNGTPFPTKPTWAPLVLDDDWPDGYIPDPNFQEYGEFDFTYTAPTPPAEVDGEFSWTENDYSSDVWQVLFAHVHNYIIGNEEYSIPEDVYNALVAMEQEARRINQNREFTAGIAATGANGLNLSGQRQSAFISQFQNNVTKLDQDALNNITVKNFELTNENRKFFITSFIELEKLIRDSFEQTQNRSLDAAKATKEYLVRFLSENVRLFLGKWEGIRIKFEANKLKIDSITARNNSETAIFVSRAEVLKQKTDAIVEKNRGLVDARTGEIAAYNAEVEAVKSEWLALLEEIKVHQENIRIEIDKELRIEGFNLQAFTDKSQLAKDVAVGVANIASQGVASALGAINTSLSNVYSGSESVGAQWGFNAGVSEQLGTNHSHTYDHGEIEGGVNYSPYGN